MDTVSETVTSDRHADNGHCSKLQMRLLSLDNGFELALRIHPGIETGADRYEQTVERDEYGDAQLRRRLVCKRRLDPAVI